MREGQALFFDAEGTLLTFVKPLPQLYLDACAAHGLNLHSDRVAHLISTFWRARQADYLGVSRNYATSVAREREWWEQFARDVLRGAGLEGERLIVGTRAVYQHFGKSTSRRLLRGAKELLHTLRQAGWYLAVFSNNDERLLTVLDGLGIREYFDEVFLSCQLGWKKPSAAAFKEVEKRAGVSASQCTLIGDNFDIDIAGANHAGWRAIQFVAPGVLARHTAAARDMSQLLRLLDKQA